ncbi:MAG: hypothetical protein M1822_006396 [Bathelium mastoideum]|nr:MAG: hypothetical protein M1822_006396 [Bathelium mastoideum]
MAAEFFTPPTTPPLRQTSVRRSIDEDLLSPLTSKEEVGRPKEATTTPCRTIAASKPCNSASWTYTLENAQILGSGLWSTVYLTEPYPTTSKQHVDLTPPTTPQRLAFDLGAARPKLYAVKVPSRGDARDVLAAEARILSYLTADPASQAHIVHFHGVDERNGALVMDAIPQMLDSVSGRLESVDENTRGQQMKSMFPCISRNLVKGLAWLHSKGVVHGDIKPSNILMDQRSSLSQPDISDGNQDEPNGSNMIPLYCDFSASHRICSLDGTSPDASCAVQSKATAGGGTWEYMAPELLALGSPDPSPASDVYALAITLLTFLMGTSPFAAMSSNRFMLRHAIKAGEPLRFAHDAELKHVRRLEGWEEWLRPALAKKAEARPTAEEWLARLRTL